MRTFHTGGVASFTFTKSMIVTNNFGYVYFKNCKCLLNYKNELIILNNFSFLIIKNFNQQENYKLSYGEKILIRNGIFISLPQTHTYTGDQFTQAACPRA
uniref:DNA-directed RNA polymerase subunit beta n=1 Tax=Cacopsylla melanoneura TaxID=428564 RepID=A0A8D9B7Z1_9HEMI